MNRSTMNQKYILEVVVVSIMIVLVLVVVVLVMVMVMIDVGIGWLIGPVLVGFEEGGVGLG